MRRQTTRCWPRVAGFSLHAATVCEAYQRGRLERLCRYITRPPIGHQAPHRRWPGPGRVPLQATVPGRLDPCGVGTAGFYVQDVRYAAGAGMRMSGHRQAGRPGTQTKSPFDPFSWSFRAQ